MQREEKIHAASENYHYESSIEMLISGRILATLSLLSMCDVIPILLIFFSSTLHIYLGFSSCKSIEFA